MPDLRFWRRKPAPFSFHCTSCNGTYDAPTIDAVVQIGRGHKCRPVYIAAPGGGLLQVPNTVTAEQAQRIRDAWLASGRG